MERALRLELLSAALGEHRRLPDPSDLQRRLTDAEIALFTQAGEFDDEVLDAGWYLHAVASARDDLAVYDAPRRRQAHQVAAHIFDLHLQHGGEERIRGAERLRYVFASQVGYIGGELTPDAAALRAREPFERLDLTADGTTAGQVAMQAGILLLALDRPALFQNLQHWRSQLGALGATWPTVDESPLASAPCAASAAHSGSA